MNIASRKIDELARRLARLIGEDVETALKLAIEERLARVTARPPIDRRAALEDFFVKVSKMPVADARSADEIINYGPDGLPS